MNITIDADFIADLIAHYENALEELKTLEEVPNQVKRYMPKEWTTGIQNRGRYGIFRTLKDSTLDVRQTRKSPPRNWTAKQMIDTGVLLGWVRTLSGKAEVQTGGFQTSTAWNLSWNGSKDGSYAVLHDTENGFTVGGAGRFAGFSGKHVAQRKLFDIDAKESTHIANNIVRKEVERILSNAHIIGG